MIRQQIFIDGEDYSKYVPYPLTATKTIDESLDMGFIVLKYTGVQTPFKPATICEIRLFDGRNTVIFNKIIAIDNIVEDIELNKYSHELTLIEETKMLERFFVGGKTLRQPITSEFAQSSVYPILTQSTNYPPPAFFNESIINVNYVSPKLLGGSVSCPAATSLFNWSTLLAVNGSLVVSNPSGTQLFSGGEDSTYTISLTQTGKYSIRYGLMDGASNWFYLTYYINVVNEQTLDIPTKSITDCINELLETMESLREGEAPRFTLNAAQTTEFDGITSPEFTFAKMTLWEALSLVGGYLHAIPRLKNNVVYFDKIDNAEQTTQDLSDYCSHTQKWDIEQFCSGIDSTIDNLVNLENQSSGQIVEPFAGGTASYLMNDTYNSIYKTLRTEKGAVEITDTNCFIETFYPIEKIVKVVGAYWNGSVFVEKDITQYVYEDAEYGCLNSYGTDYPNAKAFAIKFTQGQKNITGLSFQLPSATSLILKNYAIQNIMGASTSDDIRNFMFNVTYIPIVSARVREVKQNVSDLMIKSSVAYNQNANLIDSVAFGENLKGAVARLGNPEISKTYYFKTLDLIPKIGAMFDDDYMISTIKLEFYSEFFKCEIGLSKNYNKYNEYVGVKNELRYYEVSEKQATDRYIIHEDYLIISDTNNYAFNNELSYNYATNYLRNAVHIQASGTTAHYVGLPITIPSVNARTGKTSGQIFLAFNGVNFWTTSNANEGYTINQAQEGTYTAQYLWSGGGLTEEYVVTQAPYENGQVAIITDGETGTITKDNVYEFDDGYWRNITKDFNNSLKDGFKYIWGSFLSEPLTGNYTDKQGHQFPVNIFGVPSVMMLKAYSNPNGVKTFLKEVSLPLISLGIGNSFLFSAKFDDNYSAGNRVNNATIDVPYKTQEYVPIGDDFGQIKYVGIQISAQRNEVDNSNDMTAYLSNLMLGNRVPFVSDTDENDNYSIYSSRWNLFATNTPTTGGRTEPNLDLIIDKDNAENITLNYQVHCVTDIKGLVIGSGITRRSYLTQNKQLNYKLYILPNKLNTLTQFVDLTGATFEQEFNYADLTIDANYVKLPNFTASVNGKAWAICQDNELIFGKNTNIVDGGFYRLPYLNFAHSITPEV